MAVYAIASVNQKIDHILLSHSLPIPTTLCLNCLKFIRKDLRDLELIISWQRSKNLRSMVLEQQIEDAVDKIEDLIGFHCPSTNELLKVRKEIAYLKDRLKKGEYEIEVDKSSVQFLSGDYSSLVDYDSILGSSLRPIGLNEEIEHLADEVMSGSSKLKILLVYGMAGCGKTTLVKQFISKHGHCFEIPFLLTIAPNTSLRRILISLLFGLRYYFNYETMGEFELGMYLMNHLKGKRYLFVFDNLWDHNTWYQLCEFFPDERNKSRIICTSRELKLRRNQIKVEFHPKLLLRDDDSWELLRYIIFPSKQFNNSQLEEIGKEIAKKCEGLPLAVISMGKLLLESEKTIESWEKILEDDDPFKIKKDDNQPISKSLYLSYNCLPYHLKLCFLYMGVLPEKYDLKFSQLLILWIAEGLITPKDDECIQDTAMSRLEDLRTKSMVLPRIICSNHGKNIPRYRVHFVFRSLCLKEAQDEKFCFVMKKYVKTFPQGTNLHRRLCIHNNTVLCFKEMDNSMESISDLSSILYCGPQHKYPLRVRLSFKLLKILHALSIRFYEFPLEILELFRLRYLAITYDGQIPCSISKLWKLEFLILGRYHRIKSSDGPSYLPIEIWNLQWLKNIQCIGLDLLDANHTEDILIYLSELSGVSARSCTPKILARTRNLKSLAVHLEFIDAKAENFNFFHDVAENLHCLDSLKCSMLPVFNSHVVPPLPVFPTTISKLSLSGCGFPWKHMSTISRLPFLRELKLSEYAFSGPVWNGCEDGFPRLQLLIMRDLNIEEWRVEPRQFLRLFELQIHHCYNLLDIPIEFGDLPNLGVMFLFSSNLSLEKSARRIQQKRRLLEDDSFKLHISKLCNSKKVSYYAMPQDDFFFSTMLDPEDK